MAAATSVYVPDALDTLRDSFALHLSATRAPSTSRIYLSVLDGLRRYLTDNGMPTTARAVRREHLEAYIASRRGTIKPTSQSVEFRALQQFWKWALDEEEIDRSPMERMKPPRVPDVPVPVVSEDDFRRLLKSAEGREFVDRRDTALLLLMFDTGIRRGEAAGLKLPDIELRERLAYVTGKGGHLRAVRFGTRTAVAVDRYLRVRRGHRNATSEALWLGQDGPLTTSGLAQF